ncbi:uncharacterized protein LOC142777158 [Rhipicephalus microplus]|uniref:uncharacterized protein LOC142777158 n=1 Tax=Rhipicephalus microplus TaxID=6941 RepID=UPI003F6BAE89
MARRRHDVRRRRAEARRRAARATHELPQQNWFWWLDLLSPMCQRVMLNVVWVLALFCWFWMLRLLITVSAITLFVLGAFLIVALVVRGPTLLRIFADFIRNAFREVCTMCNEFLQDPSHEHLLDMAWRHLNR